MRVLIVEDEERLASTLSIGLRAEGFLVVHVNNGVDGLWQAGENDFATASEDSRLWGTTLSGYRKPEGVGFPGFATLGLAALGLISTMRAAGRGRWPTIPVERRVVIGASALAIPLAAAFIAWIAAAGNVTIHTGAGLTVYRSVGPAMEALAVAIAMLAVAWPRRPRVERDADPGSTAGFWAIAFVVTIALALGPQIEAGGHRAGAGPYRWLLDHVPGFDGLRVPARFLTISTLCLAILSSWGLRAIGSRRSSPSWRSPCTTSRSRRPSTRCSVSLSRRSAATSPA